MNLASTSEKGNSIKKKKYAFKTKILITKSLTRDIKLLNIKNFL